MNHHPERYGEALGYAKAYHALPAELKPKCVGLHALEPIEARRHWFTGPTPHDTQGTVNVLNLVEGPAAVVESPDDAFDPFEVHYAETFIVPAAVGRYTVRPADEDPAAELATMKASIRPLHNEHSCPSHAGGLLPVPPGNRTDKMTPGTGFRPVRSTARPDHQSLANSQFQTSR